MAHLRQRLRSQETVVGALLNLRSPDAAELMSQNDFDFLMVDGEHSSLGPGDVLETIRAIERGAAAPFVRVAEAQAGQVQWALDAGAQGILFPRVRSVADVERAVGFSRYPPDGRRGLGPGRASGYGRRIAEYYIRAREDIMVMIQIETAEAVASLPEVAAVPGVDLLFVGPGDLSYALGVPGELHHPRIQEIGRRALSECRKHNLFLGSLALDDETFRFWSDLGAQFLIVGSDAFFLSDACSRFLQSRRSSPR